MRSFGEVIKQHRVKLRLTQKQVAEKVGMSDAYICSLENDRRTPPPYYTVAAIADALQIDVERLWKIAAKHREEQAVEKSQRKIMGRRDSGDTDDDTSQQDNVITVSDDQIDAFFVRPEVQMTALGLFQKQPGDMTREEKRLVYQAINNAREFVLGSK